MTERDAVTAILRGIPNPHFMELGAYQGGDTRWMSDVAASAGKDWRGYAVEADPQNYKVLFQGSPAVQKHWGAIASYTGECDFWVCESPGEGRGSGSIREPSGHLIRNGVPYIFSRIKIPCITFDDLFKASRFDRIDVLWVDLQGGEKDMIAGGQEALKHTRHMLIESEYAEELYSGQAMREELLSLLPNWSTTQVFDYNLLMKNEAYGA